MDAIADVLVEHIMYSHQKDTFYHVEPDFAKLIGFLFQIEAPTGNRRATKQPQQ